MEPDEHGIRMESEIRKLKLALMQEQLDDKLRSFREYMQRAQNTTTTTAPEPIPDRRFESVLFAPVIGVFEVWHFVILIFIAWFFLIILINYACRLYRHIKIKYVRKSRRKSNKFNRFKDSHPLALEFDLTKSSINLPRPEIIEVSTLSYPSNEKTESKISDLEFTPPPKGDFFLYTIAEHQLLTKKTFGYKKRLYGSFTSRCLSKSDSNISVLAGKDNKSFDKTSALV